MISESMRKVAVRMSGVKADDSLIEYVRSHPEVSFERFAAKDDDELNEKLVAGFFPAVVFHDLESLLQMLWKGHADLAKWEKAGVKIQFCFPPPEGWRDLLPQVHTSLEQWRGVQRRRQIIAATILSAITLAGMAILFALLGPAN